MLSLLNYSEDINKNTDGAKDWSLQKLGYHHGVSLTPKVVKYNLK